MWRERDTNGKADSQTRNRWLGWLAAWSGKKAKRQKEPLAFSFRFFFWGRDYKEPYKNFERG
jgi:hypothetical protein